MSGLRIALGLIFALAAAYFGLALLAGGFLAAVGHLSRPDAISLLCCLAMCGGFGLAAAYTYRLVG